MSYKFRCTLNIHDRFLNDLLHKSGAIAFLGLDVTNAVTTSKPFIDLQTIIDACYEDVTAKLDVMSDEEEKGNVRFELFCIKDPVEASKTPAGQLLERSINTSLVELGKECDTVLYFCKTEDDLPVSWSIRYEILPSEEQCDSWAYMKNISILLH